MIKDLKENERVSINLLVSQATKGVTTNGGAYLNISFQDATGSIEGRKWEILEKIITANCAPVFEKMGTGGIVEGDNTRIGGGMPVYARKMLVFLIIY